MFRRVGLCCALAVTAGITGCGSSGGSGGTGPLASDSVSTIISQATANTLSAQSFTIAGGTSATLSVDLTIVSGVGCTGTITQNATKSTFIWTGKTAYAHTPTMPANEWMRGSATASNIAGLINLCRPASYLNPLLTATGVSSATRSVTTYHGQSVVSLSIPGTSGDNNEPGSIIVTNSSKPLLLNISEPGSGNFTFTGYGATKTIAAPKAG